jgi:ABC-type nitrate/sulfonate/bicarbonate transport system permease component
VILGILTIALAAIVMEALLRIFQRLFVPWQGHD